MQSDIRPGDKFRAVEAFYSGVFAPGTGHVFSIEDGAPGIDEAQMYLTGACFRSGLLDGAQTRIYRCRLSDGNLAPLVTQRARLPRPAPDGKRIACVVVPDDGPDEQLCMLDPDGTRISRHRVEGRIEQMDWSPDGSRLLLLVAGAGADLAGYQGGYATKVLHAGPSWLPEVHTGAEDFYWRRLCILNVDYGHVRRGLRLGI